MNKLTTLRELRERDSQLLQTPAAKSATAIHGSDVAEKIALRIKDASALERALIGKLESQRDFAAEYKAKFPHGVNIAYRGDDTSVVSSPDEWCKGEARLYQDFVVDFAWQRGLAIVQYGSQHYQQAVGESRTGVEIKFDQKYAKTGNLWIECGEKAQPRNGHYAKAGINRDDNSWLYVIGDYDTIFIFLKKFLRCLEWSGRYPLIENNTKTSQGFLLKSEDAHKYAVVWQPNARGKIDGIESMEEIGRRLHEIAKADPMQMSMQL